MSKFTETAQSRETDEKLMEAIERVAEIDHADPETVWDDPTPAQVVAIAEIVTNNGMTPSTDFCWGASGTDWAR